MYFILNSCIKGYNIRTILVGNVLDRDEIFSELSKGMVSPIKYNKDAIEDKYTRNYIKWVRLGKVDLDTCGIQAQQVIFINCTESDLTFEDLTRLKTCILVNN